MSCVKQQDCLFWHLPIDFLIQSGSSLVSQESASHICVWYFCATNVRSGDLLGLQGE